MRPARACVVLLSLAVLGACGGCSHEKRDWDSAQAANTIEAYEQFVIEHPKSARTSEAQTHVIELTEARDWQRAGAVDTADAYRQFLAAHPQAKNAAEARIRIENFGLNGGAAAATPNSAAPQAAAPAVAAEPAPQVHTAPPAAAHVAAPAASGPGYSVQLGAFSTEAKAQSQWRRLSARYGSELHGLASEVESAKSANGQHVYRLRAKVGSHDAARALCGQLQKHAEACVVAKR